MGSDHQSDATSNNPAPGLNPVEGTFQHNSPAEKERAGRKEPRSIIASAHVQCGPDAVRIAITDVEELFPRLTDIRLPG
jgi:hypothetical protein